MRPGRIGLFGAGDLMSKLSVSFVVLGLAALSLGQTSVPVPTLLPGQAQSAAGTYTLRPDDLVRIQVFNQPQIAADVPVARDGSISAPFVGQVNVLGKTTLQLERELRNLFIKSLRLRDPIVSVSIVRFRSLRASVGGFVNRPGTFEVRDGDTVMTLLNQGGGVVPDRSDLRRSTLRRAFSQELIPIDLHAMLIKGDTSQNYLVLDGDELNIPEETRNRILVDGAITVPGTYPYREPMTVADAISLARGQIRYRSRMSKIVVTREKVGQPGQYVRIPVDFVRFQKNGDQSQNVVLQPGDYIFVPETNTPDFQQISALANVAFILQQFGGSFFGFNLFGGR